MIADAAMPTIDSRQPARRRILGIRVDDVAHEECLHVLSAYAAGSRGHIVVTPNPEIVMRARRDRDLAAAIEGADLAPPDGVGLRWAGRLLRQPLREVVPGSDLVRHLAERAPSGQRWFLLGGAPGVAQDAGRVLERLGPLVVAGTHGGSPLPADDEPTRRLILQAMPLHVLLVAYGAPGQELWMARNQGVLGVPLAMGVGGTFNFLTGRSPLPPAWVGRTNLIWLFRLATEPWRWRRQRALLGFALQVAAEAVRLQLRSTSY
jgi:N-acetylglucosaminyldiphosphoundecaprenol N-acetyl-beta-D-mannosaminyltransferase